MSLAELKFKLSTDVGDPTKLWAELTAQGPHGAIGPDGLSAARGFPKGYFDAAGNLRNKDGQPYLLNSTDVEGVEYRLTVKRGSTTVVDSVTFTPVLVNGVIDVLSIIRDGLGQAATPAQLAALSTMLTKGQQQQAQTAQALAEVNQAVSDVRQNLPRVPTRADLTGQPAGDYIITAENIQLNWTGTGVKAGSEGPMLATASDVQTISAALGVSRDDLTSGSHDPGDVAAIINDGAVLTVRPKTPADTVDNGTTYALAGGRIASLTRLSAVDINDFGAHPDRPDNHQPVQEATRTALRLGLPLTARLIGRYGTSAPFVVNERPYDDAAQDYNPITGFQLRFPVCALAYGSAGTGVVFFPLSTFLPDQPIWDLRRTKETRVEYLGIDGVGRTDVDLIEYGIRTGYAATYQDNLFKHTMQGSNLHGGRYGVRHRITGQFHASLNNFSGAEYAAVALLEGAGDSNLIGNMVNSNNVDTTEAGEQRGAGIYVGASSHNVAVIGGKNEWNSKGIMSENAAGLIVSGVQFDVCRQVSIGVHGSDSAANLQTMGHIYSGNRFLSGGTIYDWGGNPYGGRHIVVRAGAGMTSRGIISGNSFRAAGPLAYDLSPAAPDSTNPRDGIGPKGQSILFAGAGDIRWTVANEMIGCSLGDAIGADGPNIRIDAKGNTTDRPYGASGGAKILRGITDYVNDLPAGANLAATAATVQSLITALRRAGLSDG